MLAPLITGIGNRLIGERVKNPLASYRDRKLLTTVVTLVAAFTIALVWGRPVPHRGMFFGLLGAGLSIGPATSGILV